MTIATRWEPVLTQYRAVLLGQVADELFYTIPLLGVPMDAADPGAVHQGQMAETAARLHDALQTTRLHEQLLVDEGYMGGPRAPALGGDRSPRGAADRLLSEGRTRHGHAVPGHHGARAS